MKVRLTLEYIGESFSGWQTQAGPSEIRTVQAELERAITVFLGSEAKKLGMVLENAGAFHLQASGRTDSGVHARGQVVSFSWPTDIPFDELRLRSALNGITGPEIYVHHAERVDDAFDARFTPHIKCYTYRMLLGRRRSCYDLGRAWSIGDERLDLAAMIRAAKALRGKHDFSSFRAPDCTASTTERTLLASELVRLSHEELVYFVQGTGFLKQMIRIIVGTLVEIGRGKIATEMSELLDARNRSRVGPTAPPSGLTLEWVRYLDQPYYAGLPEAITESVITID